MSSNEGQSMTVECQLDTSKQKTVTFKFDRDDMVPTDIANNLVLMLFRAWKNETFIFTLIEVVGSAKPPLSNLVSIAHYLTVKIFRQKWISKKFQVSRSFTFFISAVRPRVQDKSLYKFSYRNFRKINVLFLKSQLLRYPRNEKDNSENPVNAGRTVTESDYRDICTHSWLPSSGPLGTMR